MFGTTRTTGKGPILEKWGLAQKSVLFVLILWVLFYNLEQYSVQLERGGGTYTKTPTLTYARTRKTCFPEPSVPHENSVITGIGVSQN